MKRMVARWSLLAVLLASAFLLARIPEARRSRLPKRSPAPPVEPVAEPPAARASEEKSGPGANPHGCEDAFRLEKYRCDASPGVRRFRLIELDRRGIDLHLPYTMELFDGEKVRLVFDSSRKASRFTDNRIWRGRVLEWEGSEVTWVCGPAGVTGTLRHAGRTVTYWIQPVPGADHSVREVDMTQIPSCGDTGG